MNASARSSFLMRPSIFLCSHDHWGSESPSSSFWRRNNKRNGSRDAAPPTSVLNWHPAVRGTELTEYLAGAEDHSGLMLAARITFAHFSVSAAKCWPKSTVEPG